ncbi:hypothetical protein [Agriterribacter sp.]|uniref:hypothetical protein n=1 Tax=Agriterribacter sp. TaxID=2821509 RepID=UPI002CAF9563|nr:hypothetical protein [Agriterribacter sp.]HTN08998.1 hypothetical protein [Agriterribacter sp.]
MKLFYKDRAEILYEKSIDLSSSGNTHELMSLRAYLGANNALVSVNPDPEVIDYQRKLINNIINTARISKDIPNNQSPFQDEFKGWISTSKKSTYNEEVILYEGYSFLYIAQFLFLLQENHWINLSTENADWWQKAVSFLEQNIWTKWLNRSEIINKNNDRYFLRGRTHMASHWAGIAMYLKNMTADSLIKKECEKLQQEYDLLLKRNLKPNPAYPSAFYWNTTYDNTDGTDAVETRPAIVQDVSHGNHVVSYIVAAYKMGDKNWLPEDINKLCNTVKLVLYNKESNSFRDNVDGSTDPSRPGWGNFVADGWVKLADYDTAVQAIFKNFEGDGKMLKKYNQELQFKANLNKKQLAGG